MRRVVDVHPGSNAITKAIHAAHPADTLLIHPGTYHEALRIDKPLTLEGTGRRAATIVDAGCHANDTIHVTANGVTLRALTVRGAAEGFGSYPAEVFFDRTRSGRVNSIVARNSCDAEYGISALNTGPVRIAAGIESGFTDSGIYIGSITDTRGKPLVVTDNRAIRNARGIIVEDSNAPGVHIRVDHNQISRNRVPNDEALPSDGLYFTNSDHIRVVGNSAHDNGANGFHPNSTSDHNVFIRNTASGNHGQALFDEGGHGNCGSGNDFPIPPC
jgi:parallel beta-helix repeat protein